MSRSNWRRCGWALLLLGAAAIVSPAQPLTTLVSFNGTDGSTPSAAVVQGIDGNFYGTTVFAGLGSCSSSFSDCGTVFKITPGGALTTLHNFCSQANCADGTYPRGGLILATSGNFHGTAAQGGAYGQGTVFKITPAGILTTLYSFCAQANCADGSGPYSGLVQARGGNFYGTTFGGGTSNCGTVFRITPQGKLTTLYSFD